MLLPVYSRSMKSRAATWACGERYIVARMLRPFTSNLHGSVRAGGARVAEARVAAAKAAVVKAAVAEKVAHLTP